MSQYLTSWRTCTARVVSPRSLRSRGYERPASQQARDGRQQASYGVVPHSRGGTISRILTACSRSTRGRQQAASTAGTSWLVAKSVACDTAAATPQRETRRNETRARRSPYGVSRGGSDSRVSYSGLLPSPRRASSRRSYPRSLGESGVSVPAGCSQTSVGLTASRTPFGDVDRSAPEPYRWPPDTSPIGLPMGHRRAHRPITTEELPTPSRRFTDGTTDQSPTGLPVGGGSTTSRLGRGDVTDEATDRSGEGADLPTGGA